MIKKYSLIFLLIIFLPVKINSQFTLDNSFITGIGFDNAVYDIVEQNDGKIIVSGAFKNYNATAAGHLVRLNLNGSIDNSFNIGVGTDDHIFKTQILPDGKLLIGGAFKNYNNVPKALIARLNTDGTLDNTFNLNFNSPASFDNVYNFKQLSDGRIFVMGDFNKANNQNVTRLILVDKNGNLDNSFTLDSKIKGSVREVQLDSDNRIYICGEFNLGTDINKNIGIFRLQDNGDIDESFNLIINSNNINVSTNTTIENMQFQDDNKILITGNFRRLNDVICNNIARLNNDGTIDHSFNNMGSGLAINDHILINYKIDNNTYILGGTLTKYNSQNVFNFVVIDKNGNLKNYFNPNQNMFQNGDTWTIIKDKNNRILIGGAFIKYNSSYRGGIVRFNPYDFLGVENLTAVHLKILENPVKDWLKIEANETIKNIEIYSTSGELLKTSTSKQTNVSELPPSMYVLRINTKNETITKKIIKK
ncbi:T9SS type A sorting domain-containing protein [Soonwooa sp.]|uniref:T9SS type A sorting domain-containing protein n=1 Tax=Soonwooa sp. TaxID=1938592 RepID=UPI00262B9CC7|nr:T9SS type A sorting domain-containing protein [Soonwooa sp.]